MIGAAVALFMAVLLASSPAPAASLDRFAGEWRGIAVETAIDEALEPADLDLAITPDGNGFRLNWTSFEPTAAGELERQDFTARFAPSGRPGVFAYDDQQRSLLGRLFASPQTGNPLEGETLLWGRIEDQVLVVYGLTLGHHGGFELQRVEITRTGDELAVERSLRTGHERVILIAGRLARAGN